MKKQLILALGVLWWGCGASISDTTGQAGFSGGAGPAPATLTGKVVSEGGSVLGGVRIVAHERTTNLKASGVSSADGTFVLQVPGGVYDVGLDKEGDATTATCFYGPLEADGVQTNLTLKNSNGRTAEKIFGKIWLQPGNPAAHRGVTLRPSLGQASGAKGPRPQTTLDTNADGSFETSLSSNLETGLDVEVANTTGSLDEFIDIGKLAKPCYVEFAVEQSPVTNRLRANESELELSSQVKPAGALAASPGQFSLTLSPDGAVLHAFLKDGLLAVDKVEHPFLQLVKNVPTSADGPAYNLVNVVYGSKILLSDNGSWWWKYAVNIQVNLDTLWVFTDQTGDTYSLDIFNKSGTHKVSYNSDSPAINQMEYTEAAF